MFERAVIHIQFAFLESCLYLVLRTWFRLPRLGIAIIGMVAHLRIIPSVFARARHAVEQPIQKYLEYNSFIYDKFKTQSLEVVALAKIRIAAADAAYRRRLDEAAAEEKRLAAEEHRRYEEALLEKDRLRNEYYYESAPIQDVYKNVWSYFYGPTVWVKTYVPDDSKPYQLVPGWKRPPMVCFHRLLANPHVDPLMKDLCTWMITNKVDYVVTTASQNIPFFWKLPLSDPIPPPTLEECVLRTA